jgi:predicted nucleic acid-binding protein
VTTVLVDSNVLLDLATADSEWGPWSRATATELADNAILVVNQIIYAETSARFARHEDFDAAFPDDLFRRESLPFDAAFLAGKCHVRYRRLGGARASTLPDFFIGAHAAVRGYRLLTRDANRYRTYFPTLEVIAPD